MIPEIFVGIVIIIVVILIIEIFRHLKTVQVTDQVVELLNYEILDTTFNSLSNLPTLKFSIDPPQYTSQDCNTTAIPVSASENCVVACKDSRAQKIQVTEDVTVINGVGLKLLPGFYCIIPNSEVENCSQMYGSIVATANGWTCENNFKSGVTKSGLPLYKFVNGLYVNEIVLRSKATDEEIDPTTTFVNFNSEDYYVDTSNARVNGYRIYAMGYTSVIDPCSSVPYTDFYFDGIRCNCPNGQNIDPNDPLSPCVGTGGATNNFNPQTKLLTFRVECVNSETPPSTTIKSLCKDINNPTKSGALTVYVNDKLQPHGWPWSQPKDSWIQNTSLKTVMFDTLAQRP